MDATWYWLPLEDISRPLVVIVEFRDGKLAHEHIYWGPSFSSRPMLDGLRSPNDFAPVIHAMAWRPGRKDEPFDLAYFIKISSQAPTYVFIDPSKEEVKPT